MEQSVTCAKCGCPKKHNTKEGKAKTRREMEMMIRGFRAQEKEVDAASARMNKAAAEGKPVSLGGFDDVRFSLASVEYCEYFFNKDTDPRCPCIGFPSIGFPCIGFTVELGGELGVHIEPVFVAFFPMSDLRRRKTASPEPVKLKNDDGVEIELTLLGPGHVKLSIELRYLLGPKHASATKKITFCGTSTEGRGIDNLYGLRRFIG